MRVGVVPNLDRGLGGIYQYAVTLLSVLPDTVDESDEVVVFLYGGEKLPEDLESLPYPLVKLRSAHGATGALWYKAASLLPKSVRRTLRDGLKGAAGTRSNIMVPRAQLDQTPESLVDPAWHAFFSKHGIDLLVFTAENELAFRSGVPFAVTIQDIQHRLNPQFPEVSADGEWERREFRVGNCVRNAAQVFVDSEVGKEDICRVYELPESAVSVVRLAPAAYLSADTEAGQETLGAYDLPERFAFYPAAFWPHKNHLRIVDAIATLRDEGVEVPLVLVGSNSGTFRGQTYNEVMGRAQQLGVSDLITYLGYVEDAAMAALYSRADALVMPTFFGWTNIPVLEAFKFGCPVVYSDIRGLREQVGDAAVLVDPESSRSIAEGIRTVMTDQEAAERLRSAGYARLQEYSEEDYRDAIRNALKRAKARATESGVPVER